MRFNPTLKNVYSYFWHLRRAFILKNIQRRNGKSDRIMFSLPCGLKVNLRFKDHIAQRLLLDGSFEQAVSGVMFALVRQGMVVMDIGANIGIHTLHLASLVGDRGWVYAFEPNPVVREELEANIKLNQLNNVKVFDWALSDHDGEALFHFPEEGMEAVGGFLNTSRAKLAKEAQVKTRTLNTVLKESGIQNVGFIKLDVEGAELPVLKGAESIIQRLSGPPIVFESHPLNSTPYGYSRNDLFQFLTKRRYAVQAIDNIDYLALPLA